MVFFLSLRRVKRSYDVCPPPLVNVQAIPMTSLKYSTPIEKELDEAFLAGEEGKINATLNQFKLAIIMSNLLCFALRERQNLLGFYNLSPFFCIDDLQWRYLPVLMVAFPDHVKRMHRDNDEEFANEYNV